MPNKPPIHYGLFSMPLACGAIRAHRFAQNAPFERIFLGLKLFFKIKLKIFILENNLV